MIIHGITTLVKPLESSAVTLSKLILIDQARSHWLGWSGINLTTFIQLYNIDLVNLVTLKTD